MFTQTKSAVMKHVNNLLIGSFLLVASISFAQTNEVASNSTYTKAAAVSETPVAPATVAGKDIVITLKNSSERSIAVFAGPKENIREPKIFTYGGLSTNKLYLHENEVVCLMTSDKRPTSCTVLKPGITTVEVNTSGNSVAGK